MPSGHVGVGATGAGGSSVNAVSSVIAATIKTANTNNQTRLCMSLSPICRDYSMGCCLPIYRNLSL